MVNSTPLRSPILQLLEDLHGRLSGATEGAVATCISRVRALTTTIPAIKISLLEIRCRSLSYKLRPADCERAVFDD